MKNLVGHCNFYFFPVAIKMQSRGSELDSVRLAESQVFLFGLSI